MPDERSCPTLLVAGDGAAAYDLGDGHPMRAVRAALAVELARALGVAERAGWTEVVAPPAADEQLRLVHTETYVALVRQAERLPEAILAGFGLGTEDTPVIPGLHQAAAAVAGATIAACEAVWSGKTRHAVNLAGGLHHAMPGHASGFCVYNDAAIGIATLLAAGARRVAYVDLDAHHGDGVERCFVDDPRVLTISLHQDGRTLFPGTGAAHDTGGDTAPGSAVNVALPPGTDDAGWLRAFHAVVPERIRAFGPDVIVTQCGCDAHRNDPLSDLQISVEGFTVAYEAMHELAHETSAGRWVVLGGGGYDLGDAVPRSWAQLLAVVSGSSVAPDTELPADWRAHSETLVGRAAPTVLGDGAETTWRDWESGADPEHALDAAILQTKAAHRNAGIVPMVGELF
ncbi:acetoin utilization protein AcuC [Sporichthya brevicatena]|uniref:Acetoin utilization protein AcuC n=1 Tax=Sporichthya brevicatena TaxID=171442 RepID=A0ABN1GMX1_9ACTN